MQISFVLDWTSFWVGVVSTVVVAFLGLVIAGAVQYKSQSRRRR